MHFFKISLWIFAIPLYCFGQYYSQYRQDQYVYETFFQGLKEGVFVDIGAHDGISLSNSCFFEKELGWKGICVEPIPEVFSALQKNRNCITVCGCVTPKRFQTVQFLRITGYPEMLSGIIDLYDEKHVKRIMNELEIYGGDYEILNVKCHHFNDLLKAHGIDHVHFLSIDTEGGELEILKSIDFASIQIDVITVENNYHDPNFKEWMDLKGYDLNKELVCDQIYVRRGFKY